VFMEHQKLLAKEGWKIVNHEETLKQIGHQASQWSQAHAREIDWEIYSYRVSLFFFFFFELSLVFIIFYLAHSYVFLFFF
jgi:hypothetical protein